MPAWLQAAIQLAEIRVNSDRVDSASITARLLRAIRTARRRLAKALDPPPEADDRWDIPIKSSLRGAKELRDLLPLQESDYLFVAGSARGDPRSYVIYTALDEVKKTALYLMGRREFFDVPLNPRENRITRLVQSQVLEEQQARARRLIEVLVTLVLFSQTNEAEYYRHLLLIEELNDLLSANSDLAEFHGAPSGNIASSIRRVAEHIQRVEENIDLAKAWYLTSPSKLPVLNQIRVGKLLSSVRGRIKKALPLMTPQEKLLIGFSYAGYGMASEKIHYSINSRHNDLREGQENAGVTQLGITALAILDRCHELMGRPAAPLAVARQKMFSDESPTELIFNHTVRNISVGDFVLAINDIGEVLEIAESAYGYRSYRVAYLAKPLLPDVPVDWFQARYVRLLLTKAQAIEGQRDLVRRGLMPEEHLKQMESLPAEQLQEALRKTLLHAWETGLKDDVQRGALVHQANRLSPKTKRSSVAGDK